MTIKRTQKLWLGLGTAALIGGQAQTDGFAQGTPPAAAPAASHGHADHAKEAAPAAAAKPDGEGGESGEGGGAGLDPRIKFLRDMSLVRGHLLVGDELIKINRWEDALPHFHHPIEELYASIGPRLKVQGIRQFDTALKALAQTVQAKNANAYAAALKVVEQRMADADVGMRKFETPRIAARMKTVIATLQSAAAEYGEAIENGKFTKPVEYQDSRGFVMFAAKLFETLAPEIEKKDKATVAAVRTALEDLKTAWPSPLPPESPIKDHAAVLAVIAKVEFAASALIK
jgi:hypothetical protein